MVNDETLAIVMAVSRIMTVGNIKKYSSGMDVFPGYDKLGLDINNIDDQAIVDVIVTAMRAVIWWLEYPEVFGSPENAPGVDKIDAMIAYKIVDSATVLRAINSLQ